MNRKILSDIEPKNVMRFFEALSAVPRGSGKTAAATAFCVGFAKQRGLRYYTDSTGNVVIYKGGSAGRENETPVIIQGHLDMVWEKEAGSDFDFETQGLNLEVNGDYISAAGTTLGGDDGIAVAMALAVLDDDSLSHPPVESVFTVDEETSMVGASALDAGVLSGRRMLNIDSEEEGTLLVSCAGGARVDILFDGSLTEAGGDAFKITLGGLHGGHSGTEIDKGYASANKLMGEVLAALYDNCDCFIADINGGTMDNAITRECSCVIFTENPQPVYDIIDRLNNEFKTRYSETEPTLSLKVSPREAAGKCFDSASSKTLAYLLNELPWGVISMSKNIENLVETSLNLGVLRTDDATVSATFAVRSGVDSEKEKLIKELECIAAEFGADMKVYGEYPAWEFTENSPLQKTMTDVFYEMYGGKMNVAAIHAGLECGIFCGKIKGLDCVSFGPDILEIHTPRERLSISSVERTWRYLIKVLERI